jgi:hypothetical protein
VPLWAYRAGSIGSQATSVSRSRPSEYVPSTPGRAGAVPTVVLTSNVV